MNYPTNRQKAQRATKVKFWCGKCDAYLVGQHGKCRVCGRVNNPKKLKGC